MKYEGFYTDGDLPVKPGDKVRIKKGTTLKSMHPSKDGPYESGKMMTITVDHVLNGVSMPAQELLYRRGRYGEDDPTLKGVDWEEVNNVVQSDLYNVLIPVQNPRVVWAGAGKYWVEADINDVEIIDG